MEAAFLRGAEVFTDRRATARIDTERARAVRGGAGPQWLPKVTKRRVSQSAN